MRLGGIDWWLDLHYREKSFSGKVRIRLEDVSAPLSVDSAGLVIEHATLDGAPVPFRENPDQGTLEFPTLSSDPHQLEISYHGRADPKSLFGLYESPAGSGYVLTTMLFPTGSRRLLPTFELPTLKTVYRLVLTVDADVKAIFNTVPAAEEIVDGRRRISFAPTPPMSAYLLYLGVGPFDTATVHGGRWSVTVAASPGRASAGRYAAERATEILAEYEQYYGVPYPLPKLDLIALENFWAGGMENWGAIACREGAVLVDPSTNITDRRVVLLVLAHEIAHQWFGDLVTPVAWDDFWLNESFATFVGHHVVSRRYPQEDAWTHFLVRYTGHALDEDARSATHPVKVPVLTPEALGEVSDDVTYGKGASVLRMVHDYLGEEPFRRGLSAYLRQFQYSNARAEDLWNALDAASGVPVSRVMFEWITRPGYPVVHARWSDGWLTLRQERFRADGEPSPGTWPIPLSVVSADGRHRYLFDGPELRIPVTAPEGLRINPGRTAFVRVDYDDSLFAQLLKEYRTLSPFDQWGLVTDTHAFLLAGRTPFERFLELVRGAASSSTGPSVLATVTAISDLDAPLHDVPAFRATSRDFLRAQLDRIGLEAPPGDSDSRRQLRDVVATALTKVDADFAQEIAQRFAEFDRQPPDLRPAVATASAIVGTSATFELLTRRLRSTRSDGERLVLIKALGNFREPDLLRRAFDLIPSPGVTPSGAWYLFLDAPTNPAVREVLFEWYRDHRQKLANMWTGTPLLSLFFQNCFTAMGVDREEEVVSYFRENTPPEARMAVEQGLESFRIAMRLRRRVLGHPPGTG